MTTTDNIKHAENITESLKQRGNEAFARKDYSEAIRLFTLALESNPSQAHLLFSNRSAAKASLGDWLGALDDAEEACNLAPPSGWGKGHGRKGAALFALKRLDEAKAAYEEGLRREPGNAQLQASLSQCLETLPSQASSFPTSPQPRMNPFGDPMVKAKLAAHPKTAAFMRDPEFAAKIDEIQRSAGDTSVLMRHFSDQRIMTALGVLMGIDLENLPKTSEEGKSEPAQSSPFDDKKSDDNKRPEEKQQKPMEKEELPVSQEKAEALKEKDAGNAAYKQKKWEEALEHYHKAQALDPTNMSFLTNEAAVHFEMGSWEECQKVCEKAVEVGRENRAPFEAIAKAFLRAGSAAQKAGNLDVAIKYFNKSLAEHRGPEALGKLRECEKERDRLARLAYHDPVKGGEEREAGNSLFKAGNYADAIKRYTEAIKRDEGDVKSYSNRSACYTKLAAIPEALEDAEKCLKLDPAFIKGYLRKATAQLFKRDFEGCRTTCQAGMQADTTGTNREEFQALINKSYTLAYGQQQQSSEDDSKLPPEERARKAVERDPELQAIVSDPAMRMILQQMQSDPAAVAEHMRNPAVSAKIRKLIAAGILQVGH